VADIRPQSQIRQVFRVLDKQHRANRQGSMYLLLQLADKTGVISGIRWNSDQRIYDSFQKGDFLSVSGASQLHNGLLQLIVHDLEWVDASQIDPADFLANDPEMIERNWQTLQELFSDITDPDLQQITNAIFNTASIADRLKLAPAGVKTHHAYPGGLVQHLIDLTHLAKFVAGHYPALHRDLLLSGVLVHDIGKIDELLFEGELTYSNSGQLLGHLVQGVEIVNQIAANVQQQSGKEIDPEILLRLKHMIVSHHGLLEHGSPKVPMTMEAIALSHIDDLDAKLNAAAETIRADRNSDSPWTAFLPVLGKKLFKPSLAN
jgi:3'-5' exoribonuclease